MLPRRLTRRIREARAAPIRVLVFAGFGLITFGLIQLQITHHDEYLKLSKDNHVRLEVIRAPRGAIYDRHGLLLADSAPSFSVVFRPFPAESIHRTRSTLSREWISMVSGLLALDTTEVRRRVAEANKSGQTAILRRNAPFEMRAWIEESLEELPGVEVQIEPLRRYPNGIVAAHLLGYAGEINDKELDSLKVRGYRPGDLIGRTGVERRLEDILRGEDGAEFVVVNAAGKRVSTLSEGPPRLPKPGHDVTLTLDLKVQMAMEEAMEGVERGAAVALDPRDGGILGLVSRPAFDPNEFSVGLTLNRWRELASGGANPLLNRAIQGLYPPGSTFKIVTMLAALSSGVATPDSKFAPCGGRYYYGGRSFGCWKPTGHGSLDFVGALQHSCDVYFYQVGLKLGLPKLEATAHALGLGERTGIDLPQEKKGLVPTVAWYDKRWGVGRWPKGLLLNLSIGQGELLVTPLQVAVLLGEAATRGRAPRPHVVQEVRGVEGLVPTPPTEPRFSASDETWSAVDRALELVVSAGTATMARVPNLRIGGKTGTAQNPHGLDHALFACFAPAESPSIVLAFVIENSGHGGSIAAPKAGHVLSRLFLPDSLQAPPWHPVTVPATEVASGD